MTVLSAQSIRRLCNPNKWPRRLDGANTAANVPIHHALMRAPDPLITPFTERGVVNGKSYGLSACTYDCRIDQDLTLFPGQATLASTVERFALPHNVCGSVLDKSSWARVFVSAMNTHLDPGWTGWLTLELVNHGLKPVTINKGDPICQIKFEWLDEPTDLPYVGRKYSDQPARPVAAISEGSE